MPTLLPLPSQALLVRTFGLLCLLCLLEVGLWLWLRFWFWFWFWLQFWLRVQFRSWFWVQILFSPFHFWLFWGPGLHSLGSLRIPSVIVVHRSSGQPWA